MNRDEMSAGTERMASGRVGDQLGEKRETITVDLRETDEAIQASQSSLLFLFPEIDGQHDHNTHSQTHKDSHTHTTVTHISPALMNCCWLRHKSKSCSVPQTLSRTET